MKLTKKYYMIRMNDGSIPVITEFDTMEECYQALKQFPMQHWTVRLLETGEEIEGSDRPTST